MDPFWQCQPSDAENWWHYRSWRWDGQQWSILHSESDWADRHAAAMHANVQHALWAATLTQVFNYNTDWKLWTYCTALR